MAHQIAATQSTSDEVIRKAEQKDEWDQESITKSYHRLRVAEFPKYFNSFPDDKQQSVKDKLKIDALRVKRSRDRLANSARNKDLFDKLNKSFEDWRQQAEQRAGVTFEYSSVERPHHVKTLKSIGVEDIDFPGEVDEGSENPEHDFKAGFLFFERNGIGWKKTDVGGDVFDKSDKFPNQKATVHDALFSEEHNPFAETKDERGRRHLKYVHLPANHMGWAEQAIARYHGEDGEADPEQRRMTNQTLAREFWRGQVHGSGLENHPVHARHLRTRCLSIPLDATGAKFPFQEPKERRKNFAVFMPYLHWEMHGRKARMAEVVQEIISTAARWPEALNAGNKVKHTIDDEVQTIIKRMQVKFKSTFLHPDDQEAKVKRDEDAVRQGRFKRKTKLGIYLLNAARLWIAMDSEPEERLLKHGLVPKQIHTERRPEPALHIRRTLDQSYFLNLKDTSHRDQDQVVYRATKLSWNVPGNLARVVMVDQLWLWILDDFTIITAFPRRWGRNKPDSSGIHKSLRERLARMNGEVTSVWHLASIIIDQCSRVFFDRTRPLDLRPEVMDLFANALNDVNEHTTKAFEAFWRKAELEEMGKRPKSRYLKINPEGTILREAQDIGEELRMMIRIYTQQLGAAEDFRKSVQRWNKQRSGKKHWTTPKLRDEPGAASSMDLEFIDEMTEQIRTRKAEIEELANAAERSCHDLQDLLSLKQQQASIEQAVLSHKLSKQSYEQGKSIMSFTIMTIVFTPLGFFTSFFGMNNSSTGQTWMTLREQSIVMLTISAVIIAIFLAIAFSPTLQHPVRAAKKMRERHEPHKGTWSLELIAADAIGAKVSELSIKTHNSAEPPGSPGDGSFHRMQQDREARMRRRETFPVSYRRAANQRRGTDMV